MADVDAQIDRIVDTVRTWQREGQTGARSIAVLMLSESVDKLGARLADRFAAEGLDAFWVGDPTNRSAKDQVGSAEAPIIISTVHSSKGLEFPRVIVTGLKAGGLDDPERRATASKTLYVGFTRAVDELAVIGVADNVFAERLH